VFFGSGDRAQLQKITEQLAQITAGLAALKQQVTDQQYTIDQIRQDTTAAINAGLAEIRAVAREGLARGSETIGNPLAQINTELVSIRAALNDLTRTIPQPDPAAGPEPEANDEKSDPSSEKQPNTEHLKAAAGISVANLQAHRDTWAFLVKHASSDPHFHIPGDVKDAADIVNVRISGPSIVAALIRLDQVGRTDPSPVTRAIAGHLYDRLLHAVQDIIDNPDRRTEAEPVKISIDDRAKPVDDDH